MDVDGVGAVEAGWLWWTGLGKKVQGPFFSPSLPWRMKIYLGRNCG